MKSRLLLTLLVASSFGFTHAAAQDDPVRPVVKPRVKFPPNADNFRKNPKWAETILPKLKPAEADAFIARSRQKRVTNTGTLKIFKLKHAPAEHVGNLLSELFQDQLKAIVVDERTQQILVRGANLTEFEQALKALDVPAAHRHDHADKDDAGEDPPDDKGDKDDGSTFRGNKSGPPARTPAAAGGGFAPPGVLPPGRVPLPPPVTLPPIDPGGVPAPPRGK